jgi:hypothetical protein
MAKKFKLIFFIFGLIVFATMANFVLAQNFGINEVNNTINLTQGSDPRVIITRVIQIALSFLGVIALILIIYAGILWMTSNGDEEKIKQAQQILKNAVIGLIIILSSWAIATFIISRLFGAVNGTGGANDFGTGDRSTFTDPGMGALGACTVVSVYPENNQTDVARNSSIIITFKEEIKLASVCIDSGGAACDCGSNTNNGICNKINPQAIRIYKTDLGDACVSGTIGGTCSSNITDVTVGVSSDKKTLVLTPSSYLGDPTENISYSVKMSNALRKVDNSSKTGESSMFKTCGVDYFVWKFEVSNKLDLTPPRVVYGGIFPRPDNTADVQNVSAQAKAAQGTITINSCPNIHSAAQITAVTPGDKTPQASVTPLNYQGSFTKLIVVVSSVSKDNAQLFDANNKTTLLGEADFDTSGSVKFPGYFILTTNNHDTGNVWTIEITPEKLADTLTIGDNVYTFSGAAGNNNIPIACAANLTQPQIMAQISKIYETLHGKDPLVEFSYTGTNVISLTAKVAGAAGNNIVVSTTNTGALGIKAMSGGTDRINLAVVNDKKDVPMNTALQLNFSKPINPLKVSGLASEVADYIKVVNYETAAASSSPCTQDSQCKSYECGVNSVGAKVCIGDYIGGKFIVSNIYKTVEFISNKKCGVNGCGEEIYCLPANSHIAVEMWAADLKECSANSDCLIAPYNVCTSTAQGLLYKTCQNNAGQNYPTASSTLNGIVDTALNSFDGNRSTSADGPIAYYNDNYKADAATNLNQKDNYRFSFYVNNLINLDPPQIEAILPVQGATGATGVTLADPIEIIWNKLMLNSSLTTGVMEVDNGKTVVEHQLLNLKSLTPSALGYWVTNDNNDTAPFDGEPDQTISWIKHTPLSEAMSYRAQAGSGIKDIYQNCFKPSVGPNCSAADINPATDTNPSCCFGNATSTLGADGNCK